MSDWSELPRDLLFLIADLLTSRHDLGSFRCVCNDWRQAVTYEVIIKKQLSAKPSLMLVPKQKDQRMFYLPSKDLFCKRVELPSFENKYCLSSRGCLFTHSEDLSLSLVNPASGATINLPKLTTISNWNTEEPATSLYNVRKVALSSNPFECSSQYCKLMIIYGHIGKLAFCRLGDATWTFADVKEGGCIFDVIWYNERFYAINTTPTVFSIYIRRKNEVEITKMNCLESQPTFEYPDEWYLVKFKKMLLAVARYNTEDLWHNGKEVIEDIEDIEVIEDIEDIEDIKDIEVSAACLGFQAFAIEVHTGKVLEINDIGEGTIFLGYNSSEYVEASKSTRPNSIYFNDHVTMGWRYTGGTVLDISVFSFEDGIIEPYLKKELYYYDTPPVWIIP